MRYDVMKAHTPWRVGAGIGGSLLGVTLVLGLAPGVRAATTAPVVSSRTSSPSLSLSPLEAAREALKRQGGDFVQLELELELRLIQPLGRDRGDGYGPDGAVVRFVQKRAGVPLLGDAAVVVLLSDGQVSRWQARVLAPGAPLKPLISLAQARQQLPVWVDGANVLPGRQVYWPVPGREKQHRLTLGTDVRLAWEFFVPPQGPGAQPLLVWVDAQTGVVLGERDPRVFEDPVPTPSPAPEPPPPIANVYVHNPWIDAQTLQVGLGEQAIDDLASTHFVIQACQDLQETISVKDVAGKAWDAHVCTTQPAPGPVDGNYLYEPIPYPQEVARDEDGFSAPNLYYHLEHVVPWFETFGFTGFEFLPVEVTANVRYPNAIDALLLEDPTAPLSPLNNAYFQAGYGSEGIFHQPQLVFGQGSVSDFAYDADVVYHELTHGVVNSVGGPQYAVLDERGASLESSALNEGFADYFSSALQNDPTVGEYAGLRWEPEGAGIRDLEIEARCPEFLIGQQHNDSQPFSAALWDIRQALGAVDPQPVDQAIFNALGGLDESAQISDGAASVLASVEAGLGSEAAQVAQAALEARGLLACERVVPVVPQGMETVILDYTPIMGRKTWGAVNAIPGNVQLTFEVPAGRQEVRIRFRQPRYKGVMLPSYGTANDVRTVDILLREGNPLSFTYDNTSGGLQINTTYTFSSVSQAQPDAPLETSTSLYYDFEGRFEVESAEATRYYLIFVNWSQDSANLYDVRMEVGEAPAEVTPVPEETAEGCGACQVGGRPSGGMALWMLGLLGWGMRRKRQKP